MLVSLNIVGHILSNNEDSHADHCDVTGTQ